MKTKLLAVLLVVCMALSLMPMTALAVQESEVQVQQVKFREDGVEGYHAPIVEDFTYGDAYRAAGISLTAGNKGITINGDALISFVNAQNAITDGDNLLNHLLNHDGNASNQKYMMVGLEYIAPTHENGKKAVKVQMSDTGADDSFSDKRQYDLTEGGENSYKGSFIKYFMAATVKDVSDGSPVAFLSDSYIATNYTDNRYFKWIYEDNSSIITKADGVTVKTVVPEYTVTFNSDGGSEVAAQTKTYRAKATKPADPTKEGNAFENWFAVKADGTLEDTAYDFTKPVIGNITLKAKWKEVPALGAGTISGAILNQGDDSVKNITVTATAGTAAANGVIPVTITLPANTQLPMHENKDGEEGYWVGFAIVPPEGASDATMKCAFGRTLAEVESLDVAALESNVTTDGKKGMAFYANLADVKGPKTYAAVQWLSADATKGSSKVYIYEMDLSKVEIKKYDVKVAEGIANGRVTVNPTSAADGQKVTITATPGQGYVNGTVTAKQGSADLDLTKNDDGTYSFNMPSGDVTVDATFLEEPKLETVEVKTGDTTVAGLEGQNADTTVGGDDSTTTIGDVTKALEAVNADIETAMGGTDELKTFIQDNEDVKAEVAKIIADDNVAEVTKAEDVKIVVSTEVKYDDYVEDRSGETIVKTLKVEVSVVANIIKATDGDNAVPVSKATLKVADKVIPVTIGLPKGFVDGPDKDVFVKQNNGIVHKGKSKLAGAAAPQADVAMLAAADDEYVVDIEAKGVGQFEISTKDLSVVEIDGTGYASLAEAVDAAKDGDVIKLVDDVTPEAMVTVNKAITIDPDGHDLDLTKIEAAPGYTMTVDGGKYVFKSNSTGGSGSGSTTTFVVTANSAENGKVTVTPNNVAAGTTVTVTVTPDEGYVLDTIKAVTRDGADVALTKGADGKYTFTMPANAVIITATFKKDDGSTPDAPSFTDVPADAYYADAVKWAVENKITQGTGDDKFSPDMVCGRAQVVTFLWRAAGEPKATGENPFTDIKPGDYYYDAVLWAVEKGITQGTSATTFSPDANCSRAQIVTFLWRNAGEPEAAAGNFSDVPADAYYAKAVNWAVEKGVTQGTGEGKFSPDKDCSRAEIVTFLFRDLGNGATPPAPPAEGGENPPAPPAEGGENPPAPPAGGENPPAPPAGDNPGGPPAPPAGERPEGPPPEGSPGAQNPPPAA